MVSEIIEKGKDISCLNRNTTIAKKSDGNQRRGIQSGIRTTKGWLSLKEIEGRPLWTIEYKKGTRSITRLLLIGEFHLSQRNEIIGYQKLRVSVGSDILNWLTIIDRRH